MQGGRGWGEGGTGCAVQEGGRAVGEVRSGEHAANAEQHAVLCAALPCCPEALAATEAVDKLSLGARHTARRRLRRAGLWRSREPVRVARVSLQVVCGAGWAMCSCEAVCGQAGCREEKRRPCGHCGETRAGTASPPCNERGTRCMCAPHNPVHFVGCAACEAGLELGAKGGRMRNAGASYTNEYYLSAV